MTEHGIVHSRSQGLIDYAVRFATAAHVGQVRKYTGCPYVTHPIAVAKIVASVTTDCNMISAAILHDVIEDTSETYETVHAAFGLVVADLVRDLSDVSQASDGNRATRKGIDRDHTAAASRDAKTIKLADLIHNSHSIIEYDAGFAKVYMSEKVLLMSVLTEGDPDLYDRAQHIVDEYYNYEGNDYDTL